MMALCFLLIGRRLPATATTAQHQKVQATVLVQTFLRAHPELSALEIAIDTAGGCRTVAATDPEDVGEACDDDELGPMRTGQPTVEAPTPADSVYDITQALHDVTGRLIGAVGMDLPPRGQSRAVVVAKAATLLRELEAQIPSKARLLAPVARQP